jgi:putative ABC transport system permease protein
VFKNYLKIAYRNLALHKGFATINILGLAIGIAACILIVLFVKDELNYDKFNTKADRICRVAVDGLVGNTEIKWIATCAPLAATAVKEFPEIEGAVRIGDYGKPIINYNQKFFTEFSVFTCDSNFFNIFTFPIVQGNPQTALKYPKTLVITETTAKKIFGNENPIDKIVKSFGFDFRVTAVMKDVPKNSHIQFDMLMSFSSFDISRSTNWWDYEMATYFLLKENSNYKALEAKLPEMQKKFSGSVDGGSFEDWISKGNKWSFYLQPLTKIHLITNADGITVKNNNMLYVYIFSIVAIFILILACVNFTNLTSAKASLRFKESGIRRTVGSGRGPIIVQFILESIIITFFAAILGLFIVEISIHWFNQLTDKMLKMEYFSTWYNIPLLLCFVIVIGFIAGIFPAFQMSAYRTIDLLKEKKNKAVVIFGLREALIVFQFFISISLIVSTIIVYKQLNFVQNKNLGFDKENVIVIQRANEIQQKLKIYKEDILSDPHIISCSVSNTAPGYGYGTRACYVDGFEKNKLTSLCMNNSDFDFPATYKMEILEGRSFSNDFATDSSGILINECAVKLFNWKDPIGKRIRFNDKEDYRVIGVVKDYHYESLQKEIRPACMVSFNKFNFNPGIISVRVSNKDLPKTIEFLRMTWDKYAYGVPFEYSFLDADYGKLYDKEKRISKTLTVFSILAIFIACLGLLGLASFMAERKTKEIGIRRIHGAHSSQIFIMLAINFNKWIGVACILAWPVAWYVMHSWLQNFAYKTELSLWVFAVAGLVAFVIALITVSWQSWKAANRNPVEALRYE